MVPAAISAVAGLFPSFELVRGTHHEIRAMARRGTNLVVFTNNLRRGDSYRERARFACRVAGIPARRAVDPKTADAPLVSAVPMTPPVVAWTVRRRLFVSTCTCLSGGAEQAQNMVVTNRAPRVRRRVDPVQVALEHLAKAQEETEGELRALAEAQRRTEPRGDIAECWILNLVDHRLEVYRDRREGAYVTHQIFGAGDVMAPVAAPGAQLQVASLMP